MNNNRGSAVAIVLMILGVISLVGVALLTQSRIDTKFTAAVTAYDKTSGLADGATARALNWLENNSTEWLGTIDNKRIVLCINPHIYPNGKCRPCPNAVQASLPDGVRQTLADNEEPCYYEEAIISPSPDSPRYGEWAAVLKYIPSFETDGRLMPGYEPGKYYLQYFVAEGMGRRKAFSGVKSEVNVIALKITRKK